MANPKPGPHRQLYPYETLEQHSEAESQEPIPTPNTRALRRRMTMLLFISIVLLTLSVALWRTLHFSLPLPDFPFKMSGSLAPSCALQQLLHAASTDSAAYDYGGGCLRFAQRELPLAATQCCSNSSIRASAVHMFWNSTGRPFGDKQVATIESFVLTQPRCLELWIWTNDDMKLQLEIAALGQHAYLSDRIKILLYDPHGLSVGTPLEGRGDILEGSDVVATKADILRALILNHYDGIYVDFDSVFLQSLCPLLSIEWAYQWKVFNVLNSAVMRLTPRGETVVAMLGMMATKYPWYDFNAEIVTPLLQRSYFPHCLFDPEWETEAFIGFFDQRVDDPDWAQWYIDHAFIYHYHNQYDAEVASTSRFSRLMHALRKRADNRDQNTLVGEGPLPASCFH